MTNEAPRQIKTSSVIPLYALALNLDGGRFDRTSWKPQALVLAGMGFRVIAIDFRAAVEARKAATRRASMRRPAW